MSEDMTDYKISQLNFQIERLAHAVDKICDRISGLEKEQFETAFKRKMISFMMALYPFIMMALLAMTGFDHKMMVEAYNDAQSMMSQVNSSLIVEN